MAIELKFSKPDSSSHWGFRLVGGADFNEPLVVVKVNENSFAEDAGLMVGDVVVRVNDTPTAGITHASAHELINSAGPEFVMAIRRGLFSDMPVPSEEADNIEFENILKRSLAEQIEDKEKDQEIGPSPTILENLAGQEQLVNSTKEEKLANEKTNKPKKWSTFLVKPKNPKPVPKKVEEERKIIGEPYRVKIIKQPRRDPKDVLNRKKTVQFEPQVVEVELSRDSSIADSNESLEILEMNKDYEMEIEASVQVTEETIVEVHDADDDIDGEISDKIEPVDDKRLKEDEYVTTKLAPLDIHIDPVICESSLSLEEQLAAVQRQLLALSQLPSAIQVTLEAVTQQLNKIVLDKSNQEEPDVYLENNKNIADNVNGYEATEEEEIIDENLSVSENAEGDITENENEDQHNLDDFEDDGVVIDEDEVTVKEVDVEKDEHSVKEAEVDPYAGLTEEEKEAKIREEQLLAKKQKREEERRKMDWTQRPIVLPGGRKWSDPEDATPKLRPPKMSDEKICKTIEENSEVIVGKTKGINFLKYQPPPKNLDYLQKSEVYRLIHDMEPPVRGVGARAEKILSEKDYYGEKGAP